MRGSGYLWGFLIPSLVLLSMGSWLAKQASFAAKTSAGLQVDSRARNKMIKKRGYQIGLFIKVIIPKKKLQ